MPWQLFNPKTRIFRIFDHSNYCTHHHTAPFPDPHLPATNTTMPRPINYFATTLALSIIVLALSNMPQAPPSQSPSTNGMKATTAAIDIEHISRVGGMRTETKTLVDGVPRTAQPTTMASMTPVVVKQARNRPRWVDG